MNVTERNDKEIIVKRKNDIMKEKVKIIHQMTRKGKKYEKCH